MPNSATVDVGPQINASQGQSSAVNLSEAGWSNHPIASIAPGSTLAAVLDAMPRHLRLPLLEPGSCVRTQTGAFEGSFGGAPQTTAVPGGKLLLVIRVANASDLLALERHREIEVVREGAEAVVAVCEPNAAADLPLPPSLFDKFVFSDHVGEDTSERLILVYEPLLGGPQDSAAIDTFIRRMAAFRASAIAQPQKKSDASAKQLAELEQDRDRWRQHSAQLQRRLSDILQSSTWRSMSGVRTVVSKIRGTHYEPPELPAMPDTADRAVAAERDRGDDLHATAIESGDGSAPIVMLLESFDFGGLERVVLDLSERLTRRGRRIVILVVGQEGRLAAEARKAGIAVIGMNGDISKLESEIKRLKAQLAFAHHSYAGWDAFAAVGTPIIEVIQNIYHWQRGNGQIRHIRRHLTMAVVCSRAVRAYSIDHLGLRPNQLVLIPNGIDPRGLVRPHADELRRSRQAAPETMFVQTSHIWANKCHHTTLSAFLDVHARYPGTRLVFDGTIGHGDVGETLMNRIETSGAKKAIEVINSKNREEISRVYSRAHAFILPSIVEGLSIATLEAAWFGVPQILSDTGGARDLLELDDGTTPFGIIVKPPIEAGAVTPEEVDRIGRLERPSHVDDVAAAMASIAANREQWIDRGLAGIDRAEAFHIERTVDRYEQLIGAAVTRRR